MLSKFKSYWLVMSAIHGKEKFQSSPDLRTNKNIAMRPKAEGTTSKVCTHDEFIPTRS